MPITLRPIHPDDETFLFNLYSSVRADEIAAWGWDAAQQESFLKMQFAAQQQGYRMQFPDADHQIILRDGEPVGRIMVMRWEHKMRLVDIALLPKHRNAGIGTTLLKKIQAEAEQARKSVQLHVLKTNRAIRLYERLGFRAIGDTGVYYLMEWRG